MITVVFGQRSLAAAEVFADFCCKVTGRKPELVRDEDDKGTGDAVLIGSEAVNSLAAQLVQKGEIPALEIPEGKEDYAIRSFILAGGRKILHLAGGRVRGDHYAVYRYFREFAGCRYFWDGDRIPHMESLPLTGISLVHKFRFRYRGLRYFAHRSLHRFQAEHWDWEEWKQELEYLLKSEFNLFMLRIGNDDIFQKAYPDIVPYPPDDGHAPGSIRHSFNDRTSFWPLRYRGELRKKILDFAKSHDLMHPEDMGPFTHWYSATPLEYLEHFKPETLDQSTATYSENTMKIWDFRKEKHLEEYWAITKAHIEHYGSPELFHTIGLAERKFGDSQEGMRMKLLAYKKFIGRMRKEYPSAPLFVGSWDFMFRWEPEDVRELLKYFDPENTLILEYTADSNFKRNNYKTWGLPGNFPWIYGIFQGLEPQNTLGFDFERTGKQLDEAVNDPMCKGLVVWSENSHANARLLEYLAVRSSGRKEGLKEFCCDRYGRFAGKMQELWHCSEGAFKMPAWECDRDRKGIDGAVMSFSLARQAVLYDTFSIGEMRACAAELEKFPPIPVEFYETAVELVKDGACEDPMVFRDLIDLIRTALSCEKSLEWIRIQKTFWDWRENKAEAGDIEVDRLTEWTKCLGNILSQHSDFSIYESFRKLFGRHHVNSVSEDVLKGNSENAYCRAQISEFFPAFYVPQAEIFAGFVKELCRTGNREKLNDPEFFKAENERLRENFYAASLEDLNKVLPEKDRGNLLRFIDEAIKLKQYTK
ncbi:MAG: hypothetical protein IKA87_08140 [Lentisphaeria bacterium]|nr:hypothetical protein [Lentisphaeria bacterium]